jgi:hypothetical protein
VTPRPAIVPPEPPDSPPPGLTPPDDPDAAAS